MQASLAAGRPVEVEELPTLADSLGGGIGLDNRLTFAMVRDLRRRGRASDRSARSPRASATPIGRSARSSRAAPPSASPPFSPARSSRAGPRSSSSPAATSTWTCTPPDRPAKRSWRDAAMSRDPHPHRGRAAPSRPLDTEAVDCVEAAFAALATKPVAMPPILRLDIPEHRGEVDVKTAYVPGLDGFAIKVSPGFFDNPKLGLPSVNGLMMLLQRRDRPGRGAAARQRLSDRRPHRRRRRGRRQAPGAAGCLGRRDPRRRRPGAAAAPGADAGAADPRGADLGARRREGRGRRRRSTPSSAFPSPPCRCRARRALAPTSSSPRRPPTTPILMADWLQPGQHVTAMGSDAEHKNELEPALVATSRLRRRQPGPDAPARRTAPRDRGGAGRGRRTPFPSSAQIDRRHCARAPTSRRRSPLRPHRHRRPGHGHRHPCPAPRARAAQRRHPVRHLTEDADARVAAELHAARNTPRALPRPARHGGAGHRCC